MTGKTRTIVNISGSFDRELPFGPWAYDIRTTHEEFFGVRLTVSNLAAVQLLGGVDPAFTEITTIAFLFLRADQDLLIGLDGVDAQTAGWTLSAGEVLLLSGCILESVEVYNTANVDATVALAVGGS